MDVGWRRKKQPDEVNVLFKTSVLKAAKVAPGLQEFEARKLKLKMLKNT